MNESDLETALAELAMQEPITAETIEELVRRYPQFAKELRAAAPSLALEILAQEQPAAGASGDGQRKQVVKSAKESFFTSLRRVKGESDSRLRATR